MNRLISDHFLYIRSSQLFLQCLRIGFAIFFFFLFWVCNFFFVLGISRRSKGQDKERILIARKQGSQINVFIYAHKQPAYWLLHTFIHKRTQIHAAYERTKQTGVVAIITVSKSSKIFFFFFLDVMISKVHKPKIILGFRS